MPLTPDEIIQAAELLTEARRDHRTLPELPDALRPRDEASAYAIQRDVARRLGPVAGWKVGAGGPDDIPTCAPLPADRVAESPARLPAGMFHGIGVEAEIAFRFARDLPPRDRPYSEAEVLDAIDAAMPAIEIVDGRLADGMKADPLSKLADHLVNGAFIHGAPLTDWRGRSWTRQLMALSIDGKVVAEAVGGSPVGEPYWLLVWLANVGSAPMGGIRAREMVTTGSRNPLVFAPPGAKVTASFPGLGDAEAEFTAG